MDTKNEIQLKKKRFLFSGREIALSFQHLFAMFGATVLVPLLTGLSPAVALFTAGIGTLVFHLLTKLKVPVFLGSSFAFIPALIAVGKDSNLGVEAISGGIIVAGLIYAIFAVLAYFLGAEKMKKIFPPIVVGPIVILIGLSLAFAAINDARGAFLEIEGFSAGQVELLSWGIALFTLVVTVFCMIKGKGVFKLIPILIGLTSGYLLCMILTLAGVKVIDFEALNNAKWINLPYQDGFLALPTFKLGAILLIAPVSIVTFMEHIGDISASSKVVGKDFIKDPGLHRTLLGDGIASAIAGFFGGPANTTYSENTGVLAATKNYDPRLLRLTAVLAIVLAFLGKLSGLLITIPSPVKGGIEWMLFGMISAVGFKTLMESKVDMLDTKSMLVVGLTLTIGVGITVVSYSNGSVGGIQIGSDFSLSPLFVATIVGVVSNVILRPTMHNNNDSRLNTTNKECTSVENIANVNANDGDVIQATKQATTQYEQEYHGAFSDRIDG